MEKDSKTILLKEKHLWVLFLVMLCCTFCGTVTHAVEFTVTYGPNEHFPFVVGDTVEVPVDKPGIAIEMIRRVGQEIEGLDVRFVRLPWERMKAYLKNNTVDGLFGASYKKKRLALGWFPTINHEHDGAVDPSRRLNTHAYSLYKKKDALINWDGKNFINLEEDTTFVASLGSSIVEDMRKKGLNVETCQSWVCTLDMLNWDTVTGAFILEATGDSLLKTGRIKGVVKVEPPIVAKDYYLMLSHEFVHNYPQLSQKIWDTLRKVRENELDSIASRYVE